MIQACKEWAEIELKLDNYDQIHNNIESSNSIIKLAIDIINIMNNNKVINLKIKKEDFTNKNLEFIHYLYLIYLHIKPMIINSDNTYTNNIYIDEFNNNNFEDIIKLIKLIINNNINQNNIDKLIYNFLFNNDNNKLNQKFNIILPNNNILLNNINNNDNIQYEIFNKTNINNKLNEFQIMLLDNISIIHDSLENQRKISYCNNFKVNRNNSYPKINRYPTIISTNYNTNNLDILNNNNNKYIKNKNELIRNGFSIDINKILDYRKFQNKSYNNNDNNTYISNYNINKITKIYYHNYFDSTDIIDFKIRNILNLYNNKTINLHLNNNLNIKINNNYNLIIKNDNKNNNNNNKSKDKFNNNNEKLILDSNIQFNINNINNTMI